MNWALIKKILSSKRVLDEYDPVNDSTINDKIESWGTQFNLSTKDKNRLKKLWKSR